MKRHGARLACEGCLPVPLLRILSFLIIGPTLSRASRMERVLKTQAVSVVVQHSVHKQRREGGRLLGETQPHVETRKAMMKGPSCSYHRPIFSTVVLAIVSLPECTLRFFFFPLNICSSIKCLLFIHECVFCIRRQKPVLKKQSILSFRSHLLHFVRHSYEIVNIKIMYSLLSWSTLHFCRIMIFWIWFLKCRYYG